MTIIAETAEHNMARRHGFCGNCGTAFTSADDQYCRTCGQSEHHTGTAPRSAATRWSWRFLVVIPAFVAGYFVPGMLVRISTELLTFIPGAEVFVSPMSEVGQAMVDGACAVLFPRAVAPHAKMGISVIAAIVLTIMTCLVLGYSFLVNYYGGVGVGTVIWQMVLILVPIISAWVAVLYAHGEANRVLST